jgi:hypothetical protein
LSNRRLLQACGRALDAVADETGEVRARTGNTGKRSDIGSDEDFARGLREFSVAAACQASMRTAGTVKQRSLTDFLQ